MKTLLLLRRGHYTIQTQGVTESMILNCWSKVSRAASLLPPRGFFAAAAASCADALDLAEIELSLARSGEVRPIREVFASRPSGACPIEVVRSIAMPKLVPNDAGLTVVIPTRDRWGQLDSCLKALERTARIPSRLKIVILDNARERVQHLVRLRMAMRKGVSLFDVSMSRLIGRD